MIIVEVGQNHCGDMELARTLIRLAKDNGADLVKFQLYDHKKLYPNNEVPNTALTQHQANMLFKYGEGHGIEVFFSVFDVERVKWCEEMGVKTYKIACDRITDELFYAIPNDAELIVSYSHEWEGERYGQGLLCVPRYPAWLSDYRFSECDFGLGYDGISDHTIGLTTAKVAIARGAKIIEKHFAIDHFTGVDSAWSMTPFELKQLKEWHDEVQKIL